MGLRAHRPAVRVYKRGKVYWAQLHGERFSLRTTDRKAAELAYRAEQRKSADPESAAADEATLADWADRMLRAKRASKAAGTYAMYRVKISHWTRLFPGARLAHVGTPDAFDMFVARRRKEGASDSTIGKELTAAVQVLKLARRAKAWRGDIGALRPPDFSARYTPRERVLSAADETKLRAESTPAEWAAIALLLATACRDSEARRIRPADIDWPRRELRIRGTKTAASAAIIPIVDRCGMAARLREAEPFLPLKLDQLSKRLPRLCKRAGVLALTPNDLRRTAATRLIEAGIDAYTVAKITRHVTLGMLKRVYDRASVAATRERIDGTPEVQRADRDPGGP